MACFLNWLRPRRNKLPFAGHNFKCIFLNENVLISIKVSLKFIPKGPINNNPELIQRTIEGKHSEHINGCFYSVLAKHFNNIDLKCIDAVKFFRRIPPKVSADDFLYDNYKLTERDRSKLADGGFRGRFY